MLDSASRDSANFREALSTKLEEDDVTAATKSVLLGFKNSATLKVVVLDFYTQVNVRVNHVLKLVRPGHLTVLSHLADNQYVASMLLCVVSK